VSVVATSTLPSGPAVLPTATAERPRHRTGPNTTAAAVLRTLQNLEGRPLVSYLAVRSDLEQTLRRRSRQTALTVVGAHLPADAPRAVDHEGCPVLVYGPDRSVAGPVLLALDDDANTCALATYAAAEADRLGVPLRVVHVWTEKGTSQRQLSRHNPMSDADRLLADVLYEHLAHIEVTPERQLVHDRLPAHALVDLSGSASLLVVAARSRVPDGNALLGDTVTALLGHTRCPLAILPQHDTLG
jgi:nucleotide-binding universal stress UspA family protein